jgi:hypothetical protein
MSNLLRRVGIAIRSIRRESSEGWVYAARWFCERFYFRCVAPLVVPAPRYYPSDLSRPLTVIVPAADKDTAVLPLCLRSAREMIRQPLEAVLVVSPESSSIREIASREGCTFVHEDTLLPRPAAELRTRGWVLQQLIKFNACHYVRTTDYLVLDADTVFLRPQMFFRGGKSMLRYSDQYELLYNRSLELVFGHRRRFPVSFVTHHMLFRSDFMKELLSHLERRFARPWWEAILHEVDQGHLISFSEYELYGNFVLSRPGWRRDFVLEYWKGLDRSASELSQLTEIRNPGSARLNSVSFHWHTQ